MIRLRLHVGFIIKDRALFQYCISCVLFNKMKDGCKIGGTPKWYVWRGNGWWTWINHSIWSTLFSLNSKSYFPTLQNPLWYRHLIFHVGRVSMDKLHEFTNLNENSLTYTCRHVLGYKYLRNLTPAPIQFPPFQRHCDGSTLVIFSCNHTRTHVQI